MSRHLFITGMSRSGTTWISDRLNSFDKVVVIGETAFWGRLYIEPEDRMAYSEKEASIAFDSLCGRADKIGLIYRNLNKKELEKRKDKVLGSLDYPVTPCRLYDAFIDTVNFIEGTEVCIEKTPHHINWIDRIIASCPESKIIVMKREPYGFMLSYKHQGDRKPERTRKAFKRRYHPAACAIVWRGYMRSIRKYSERYPDSLLVIDNEEIAKDPVHTVKKAAEFLNIPVDGESITDAERINSSFQQRGRKKLSGADVFWMNLLAAKEIVYYGVREQKVLYDISVVKSFLDLPAWAVINMIDMKRIVKGSLFKYLINWMK